MQNLSIGVNVVSKGSPSRMRRVRLISFGMTILPKSSTLLTMPVAFIYLSPFLQGAKPPLCKGQISPLAGKMSAKQTKGAWGWHGDSRDGGIVFIDTLQSPSQLR